MPFLQVDSAPEPTQEPKPEPGVGDDRKRHGSTTGRFTLPHHLLEKLTLNKISLQTSASCYAFLCNFSKKQF